MRFCLKCGKDVGKEDTFCSYCGEILELREKYATGDENPYYIQRQYKKKKITIIISIVLLVILSTVAILLFSGVIKRDRSKELIGKWKCPTMTLYTVSFYTQYTFNQDGTYAFDFIGGEYGTTKVQNDEFGTYKFDGKTLILTHGGETEERDAYLNGNSLSISNGPGLEDAVFTKLTE